MRRLIYFYINSNIKRIILAQFTNNNTRFGKNKNRLFEDTFVQETSDDAAQVHKGFHILQSFPINQYLVGSVCVKFQDSAISPVSVEAYCCRGCCYIANIYSINSFFINQPIFFKVIFSHLNDNRNNRQYKSMKC